MKKSLIDFLQKYTKYITFIIYTIFQNKNHKISHFGNFSYNQKFITLHKKRNRHESWWVYLKYSNDIKHTQSIFVLAFFLLLRKARWQKRIHSLIIKIYNKTIKLSMNNIFWVINYIFIYLVKKKSKEFKI